MPQRGRHLATHGQALLLLAVGSLLLLGFLALATDVGYLLSQRRGVQNAADAGALAAALAMLNGETNTTALTNTARYYARQNGYDVAPTVTPDFAGKKVAVDITFDVPKFFLGAVYSGAWRTSAHAVAKLVPEPKPYALLALKRSGTPINLTGNVGIHVVGGGTMSNGNIACTGNRNLASDLTSDAHGTISEVGNCHIVGTEGRETGVSWVDDPLATTPTPPIPARPAIGAAATCQTTSTKITCPPGHVSSPPNLSLVGNNMTIEFAAGDHQLTGSDVSMIGNNGTLIFNPGTYYFSNSDISLTGNGMKMVFNPGDYTFYFDGGSIDIVGNPGGIAANTRVDWYFKNSAVDIVGNTNTSIPPGIYYFDGKGPTLTGNQKVSGQDVLFYLDHGAGWKTTGNTSYDFRAATGELYPGMQPGMLIFSGRGNDAPVQLTGNAGAFLRGIVYLPDAELQMTGNASGTWAEGQMIVNEVTFTGNADVDIKYKSYVDISTPAVYLVE